MGSIQEQFFPDGRCFGCGPANDAGLGLRSFPEGHGVAAWWHPRPQHQATPGVLCGGVIGTLIDCHSGAALAHAVRDRDGRWPWKDGPGWATAEYTVQLLRPTPLDRPLRLSATVTSLSEDTAVVTVDLDSGDKLRATGKVMWRRLRT